MQQFAPLDSQHERLILQPNYKISVELLQQQSVLNLLTRCCVRLTATLMLSALICSTCHGDELVLDESLTEITTVGDFEVSPINLPLVNSQVQLLDEKGQISTGQLFAFFKSQGITKLNEIHFSLDVEQGIRTDYDLDSIELSIDDLKYTLGDNSLRLPGYEASSYKPEAQIAIKLDYDFMEKFNENSTEMLKMDFGDGKEKANFKVAAVLPDSPSSFSALRFWFVIGFAAFWVVVFFVLFRMTAPRDSSTDGVASAV